jgi:hypothetical protein
MINVTVDQRGASAADVDALQSMPEFRAFIELLGVRGRQLGVGLTVIQPGMPKDTNAAVAAVAYALETDEGMAFLRAWNYGDFDVIRREWPDAPKEVFIGADPLACPHCGAAHARGQNTLCRL